MPSTEAMRLRLAGPSYAARRLTGRRLALMALCELYVILVWQVYERVVSPIWSYAHYSYVSPSVAQVSVALLLALLCGAVLPVAVTRPSNVVVWVLFLFVIGPCLAVLEPMRGGLEVSSTTMLTFETVMVACFVALHGIYRLPTPGIRTAPLPELTFWTWLSIFALVLYAVVLASTGIHLHISGLSQVYSTRAAFESSISGPAGYAASWLSNLINPMFMAYGLAHHRYRWFVLGLAGQVLMYALAGYKAALFSFAMVLAFYWLLNRRRRGFFGRNVLIGTFGVILGATLLDRLFSTIAYTGYVTRRTFVDQAVGSGLYVDYFSRNPHDHLAHSLFHLFVHSPYAVAPSYVIGSAYFPGTGQDFNANLWADAYANFGIIGMVAFTIVLAIILLLYDGVTRSRDLRFAGLILAVPAISLSNSGVFTTIATHGLGLAIVFAFFLPSVGKGVTELSPTAAAPAAQPTSFSAVGQPRSWAGSSASGVIGP